MVKIDDGKWGVRTFYELTDENLDHYISGWKRLNKNSCFVNKGPVLRLVKLNGKCPR